MGAETVDAVQSTMASESSSLIKQLFGHFDSEWQQIAIASLVIIFILGVGLTEVCKRLNIAWLDSDLPESTWRRNVQRFAFGDAMLWTLIIMPAIVSGSWYVQAVKVLVMGVVNGVLTLLGFDLVKKLVKAAIYLISEKLRGYFRKKLVDEPQQRGEEVNEEKTLVKWAMGKKEEKKP